MSFQITRRLEIDAGHRLLRHESKCRNYHGHRYRFDITVQAAQLDDVGRVVDFSVVKELVGGWLDDRWDHAMLLELSDPMLPMLREKGLKFDVLTSPPTAENLARNLHKVAEELLGEKKLKVVNVRCYETPNCWADSRDIGGED